MNHELESKIKALMAMAEEISSIDGGTDALEKAFGEKKPTDKPPMDEEAKKAEEEKEKEDETKKAAKAEEDKKKNDEAEEMEKKGKAYMEAAKTLRKALTDTPSHGADVNDSPDKRFADLPDETLESIKQIGKSVEKLSGIVKDIQTKNEVLERALNNLLAGIPGVAKALGLESKTVDTSTGAVFKDLKNGNGTPITNQDVDRIIKGLRDSGIVIRDPNLDIMKSDTKDAPLLVRKSDSGKVLEESDQARLAMMGIGRK